MHAHTCNQDTSRPTQPPKWRKENYRDSSDAIVSPLQTSTPRPQGASQSESLCVIVGHVRCPLSRSRLLCHGHVSSVTVTSSLSRSRVLCHVRCPLSRQVSSVMVTCPPSRSRLLRHIMCPLSRSHVLCHGHVSSVTVTCPLSRSRLLCHVTSPLRIFAHAVVLKSGFCCVDYKIVIVPTPKLVHVMWVCFLVATTLLSVTCLHLEHSP
jgi:hypothetical protein